MEEHHLTGWQTEAMSKKGDSGTTQKKVVSNSEQHLDCVSTILPFHFMTALSLKQALQNLILLTDKA